MANRYGEGRSDRHNGQHEQEWRSGRNRNSRRGGGRHSMEPQRSSWGWFSRNDQSWEDNRDFDRNHERQFGSQSDPYGYEDPSRNRWSNDDSYRNQGRGTGERYGSSQYRGGNLEQGYERDDDRNRFGYGGQQYGSGQYDRGFNDSQYGGGQYGNQYGGRSGGQYGGNQYGSGYGSNQYGGRDDDGQQYGGSHGRGQYGSGQNTTGSQYGWGQSGQQSGGILGGLFGEHGIFGSRRRSGMGPKGYRRSDERIKEDVSDRLSQTYDVDASEVEVSVANGEVTLTGTVPHREMKFRIEHIADGVSGVADVTNQIKVKHEERQQNETSSNRDRMGGGSSMGSGSSLTGTARR